MAGRIAHGLRGRLARRRRQAVRHGGPSRTGTSDRNSRRRAQGAWDHLVAPRWRRARRHRAPPRSRHERAAGRGQDRGCASQPGPAAQRSLARAHVLGARPRRVPRGHRDHRRADRASSSRPAAHGDRRGGPRGDHRLSRGGTRSPARPSSISRCAPGGRTRFACISPRSVTRSSATRCTDVRIRTCGALPCTRCACGSGIPPTARSGPTSRRCRTSL